MGKKKNTRQRRVLTGSLVLSAVIVAGGTFAWFTSVDEVTNRLTAKADYGVSLTENFTPPEDWVPGQEISKQVGAINTGNISAFVKLTVSNAMQLTYAEDTDTVPTNDTKDNYVILSTSNPNEVLAAQAGGYLAYTNNTTDASKVGIVGIGTGFSPNTSTEGSAAVGGVYIFRRSIDVTSTTDGKTTITETFEYDGYYFDGTNYYKLTDISYTEPATEGGTGTWNYKYAAKKTELVEPTFTFEDATTGEDAHPARIVATYDRLGNNSGNEEDKNKDDIVIYINLATNAATNWTNGGMGKSSETAKDNTAAYFYLNQILAPDGQSGNLIESVELSDKTEESAYLNFDYDLNIKLDSVQAIYDTDGTIKADKSEEVVNADTTFAYTATVGTVDGKTAPVTWTAANSSTTSGSQDGGDNDP